MNRSIVRILACLPLMLNSGACSAQASGTESSWQFLVSEPNGVLYRGTAGELRGLQLPLSFVDSAAYWGEHVCQASATICGISDVYDASAFTLRPHKGAAGDLQTERVNTHNGTNIYDAATWQIAVMLGAARNGMKLQAGGNAYALAGNQNLLLKLGYSGDAAQAGAHQNRALTQGEVFRYNDHRIEVPQQAWMFRTLPRAWLAQDPLINSPFSDWIQTKNLPVANSAYRRGVISWTDWKPIAGENAWAFLIGPLQAAQLNYVVKTKYAAKSKNAFVPFRELAVQNALAVLPTFAAMQSPIGAVYYAPSGTVANQGDELVNRYEVAVENNFSLYAGLRLLNGILTAQRKNETTLSSAERSTIDTALQRIHIMLHGGELESGRSTQGLLAFFKNHAWRDGEFIQGGFANDQGATAWVARIEPKAVDVNTWGIAALGTQQIDAWFGFGAAFDNWQRVKGWGGYGTGRTLWGVGFSDRDGNGLDKAGNYRRGILSAEWTAGAITAVREMHAYYGAIGKTAGDYAAAQRYVKVLREDEVSMLEGLQQLRSDRYVAAGFPGTPKNFAKFFPEKNGAYLYASKRYLIPFGWYANPLPSTCSTAWAVMVANNFNPFVPGETH